MLSHRVELEAAFHPDAIAVVGASDDPVSFGHQFVRHLLDYRYPGRIYPVNPNKQVILGLRAYPGLNSIPEPLDYAIFCVPASKIPALLDECPDRGVRIVHIFSGRLGETDRQEAKALEAEILQRARRANVRLIGPNCMGVYHPRGGIGFAEGLPDEPGEIGGLFQSGGLATMFARYGGLQGLRFSKIVSYGNAIDIDESDFLDYFAHDDETSIIAGYIEGVRDGRRFLQALGDAARAKPVIIIKGGRDVAGTRAAASHTAAIAGSNRIWETAFGQAGVIQAQDLDELVNLAVAFSFLPSIRGRRVGVIGGGGGTSVLSADACEEAGLVLPPIPPEIDEELRIRAPELQGWLGNPVDVSMMAGASIGVGKILRMAARSHSFDFMIVNISEDAPLPGDTWSNLVRKETENILNVSKEGLKPLLAVVSGGRFCGQSKDWRWKLLAEQRARLVAARVPTYSTVAEAAKTIRLFIDHCGRDSAVSHSLDRMEKPDVDYIEGLSPAISIGEKG